MHWSLLDEPYVLSAEQKAFYRQNGYIKLKEVLSAELTGHFNHLIAQQVQALPLASLPLEQRNTYGKAFLQAFNLWTLNEHIRPLVFSKRLAQLATDLMGVAGVRLYHDQALFKEAGGGITPWHADQHYWPMASDNATTLWIPLQATPLEMGPLEFSPGSQVLLQGRELSIGDESEAAIQRQLKINDFPHHVSAFDLGEVSFHSGWIFHRAGANSSQEIRKVMTIIYMDKDMRLKGAENKGQLNDAKTWCPGIEVGQIMASALNPLLYEQVES